MIGGTNIPMGAVSNSEQLTVNVQGMTSGGYISVIEAVPIDGYTEVEYIESSGTQYIDTGFKMNQNTRVTMKVQPTSITANAWAFEGRISFTSASKGVFYYYSSTKLWSVDYNSSSNRQSIDGVGATDLLEIDYNKNVCTINGVFVTNTEATFQSNFNLTLLAANTAGSIAGYLNAKLYSCQIYDNGTLIRDYVPVKSEAGVYGLYDKVNKKFYESSGSNGFSGGADVGELYGLGDTISIQTTSVYTHSIPPETKYIVKASDIDNLITPEQSEMFEAVANNSRTIKMTYIGYGAYILDTAGKYWTEDTWDDSAIPECIAIRSAHAKFGISLTNIPVGGNTTLVTLSSTSFPNWHSNMVNAGATEYGSLAYNGALSWENFNTGATVKEGCYYDAKSFTFPSGKTCYVLSAGQLLLVRNNIVTINNLLEAIGENAFEDLFYASCSLTNASTSSAIQVSATYFYDTSPTLYACLGGQDLY